MEQAVHIYSVKNKKKGKDHQLKLFNFPAEHNMKFEHNGPLQADLHPRRCWGNASLECRLPAQSSLRPRPAPPTHISP